MVEMPSQPHWLYEDGIGEARAAFVSNGRILEAVIEREGGGARAGAILPGRLAETIVPRRRGIARLDSGEEVLIEPIPPKVAEGAAILVEITREALYEPGLDGVRPKRALGSLGSGAVRIAPAVQGRLGLAEGIESALSAMQLFGIPCWATLGNERFGLVSIPESVRKLFLFIDNDAGGSLAEHRRLVTCWFAH